MKTFGNSVSNFLHVAKTSFVCKSLPAKVFREMQKKKLEIITFNRNVDGKKSFRNASSCPITNKCDR